MKITQEVRDYAANQGSNPQNGMQEKSIEFRKKGAQIYQ
jgi:phosphomethylpyrimidine synthase